MTNSSSFPRRPGTRERILTVALNLLNTRGLERVTTRLIADSSRINEGNLYYYFRTKEALCLALFARLEEDALRLLSTSPPQGASLQPYTTMLKNWFLLSWSYRFLFREIGTFGTGSPMLRRRVRRLSLRLRAEMERILDELREHGLIALPHTAQEHLLANLWIVGSYWMSYLVLHQGVRTIRPAHLDWGLTQLRSLYEPYLTKAGQEQLVARHTKAAPLAADRSGSAP